MIPAGVDREGFLDPEIVVPSALTSMSGQRLVGPETPQP
jgi:hypothetical protein